MSYVTVQQFHKSFGAAPVFQGIDFSLEQGEFVTLLGPSGCGKSTLLRCIAGLEHPDAGQLWIAGEDMTQVPPQRRQIGMVFQSYALFPNLCVEDNIAFGLKMARCEAQERARRVAEAIRLVELGGKERHLPHELSGGQRQRVALARALVMRPRILLLDEPLSALDARIRKSLREQIRDIQSRLGLTTLFVTHDQEEALQLSDRVFVMDRGRIVQAGSAEEVYTRPANALVASFMGHYNLLSGVSAQQWFGHEGAGQVAVRPEAIGLIPLEGATAAATLTGQILGRQLLGNVIRYRMDVQGVTVYADRLNRSTADLLPLQSWVALDLSAADWNVVQ